MIMTKVRNQVHQKAIQLFLFSLLFGFLGQPGYTEARPYHSPASVGYSGKWGGGFAIGSLTALTGKYWRSSTAAVDFGLTFSANASVLFADYLVHYPQPIPGNEPFLQSLSGYLGVGAMVASSNGKNCCDDRYVSKNSGAVGLALRAPLGIEWIAGRPPLGVFGEIYPALSIVPQTEIFIGILLGVRYYF